MNSQDNPIDANNNLDESLSNATSGENVVDARTNDEEIITESILEATAIENDSEAMAISSTDEDNVKSEAKDLDLDDWDFRNLNSSDLEEETEVLNLDEPSIDDFEAIEIDEIVLEPLPETGVETAIEDNFNISDDLPTMEDELVDLDSLSLEPMAMDLVQDEPLPDLDNSELSLGNLDDLGNSEELDLTEESLADFSLDDPIEPDLLSTSSDLTDLESDLEIDRFQLEPVGDLNSLDGLDELNIADDNLDLLSLEVDSQSLDNIVLEPLGSLDALELDPQTSSLNLDSLLDEAPLVETPPEIPAAISTPIVSKAPTLPTPAPTPAPIARAQAYDQTMRVSVRKLDDLNNLIGELVVKRNRLEEDQERLRRFLDNLLGHVQSLGEAGAKMHDMYERSLLEGALMASRQSRANSSVGAVRSRRMDDKPQEEGLDALEMDRFTGFHLLSQDIIELIVRVREAASDIQFVVDETDKVTQTLHHVTTQLQDGMNSSRMVAFEQVADRLPRAVRDISRKQKKQTSLHVEGKEVLIDKMIVEHLYNPMTHLVNNAIAHGIESPEVRLKNGKGEVGNVYIRASIQGNQTVITVRDDGAGINPDIVKQKAVEKNILSSAAAQNLSEQQVYELLFHPGFSTKDKADDFSGRGVGMDVVNTDLKKVRGTISTESELGKGTTFTIRLPLVLSICKALTCVDNNMKIAFPIDGVEDTKEYLPSDIQPDDNEVRWISWNGKELPLRPLNSLLSYNRQIRQAGIYNANQNNDNTISVVILRSLDNLLAIEVDEVKAEQEIVIKQIDGPVAKPHGIAGATVLGDGSIMPIGDVLELVEIAQGKRTIEIGFNILPSQGNDQQEQTESVQREPMVLVVDDSITVRELLSMSFNKLNYRVEQARDGQEAWDKLRGGLSCDMIFSDIEMPRMNGLELLSNLHKDSKLKSIPVAMLTSRGAEKHRKIAIDLGAKAYLTKPYTEKDLMDVAQHLIEINQTNQEVEPTSIKASQIIHKKPEPNLKHIPLVLIIDDSVTVRELLSMTFKKAGYRVEQARDGQEAWEKLSDGLDCDIAFCDIEMPRMNGLELLSQLQKDEKLASLPIAMLTSRGAQKMRNIAASRGANGYFVKPYIEEDLLKGAKRMMNGENLIEGADGEG